MKKILLTLLFATNCHANNQLQEELNAKQSQLSLLTEQIMQKEEKLSLILKKIQDSLYWLKKNKQAKLNKAISDEEMDVIVMNEVDKFLTSFNDISNKKEQLLFDRTILDNLKASTRFYIVVYMQENILLEELIKKWALLNDDIGYLKNELKK